jgi:ABC-type transport system involved in multi-copper enzyme maturation permease subunit
MRSIWHSLAWKEWHEHKWKLAAVLAVMWSLMAVVVLVAIHGQRNVVAESFQVAVLMDGIPLAMFVGLGIASGEQSRGTLAFIQALPVPMWRLALHKLGFAILTLVVPVLLTMFAVIVGRALISLMGINVELAVPRESMEGRPFWSGSWFVDIAFLAAMVAASLVIWSAACGVNRKDEVNAGVVALLIMVLYWFALFAFWLVLLERRTGADTARLRAVGSGSAPLGFLFLNDVANRDSVSAMLGYFSAFAVHAMLVAWYVLRFGRIDEREIRSPRVALGDRLRADFLAPPRRFKFGAIAWKQFRETAPIALAGLISVVAIVTIYCFVVWFVEGKWDDEAADAYAITATVFGFFIALVAGIGVSLNDGESRLNTFWRSRPIQPDAWFWAKFITGLAIVLTVIYLPIGLIGAISGDSFTKDLSNPDVYLTPAMQIALFAAAVMVTSLVRQAVYSAILSIAAVYIGLMITLAVCIVAGFLGLVPIDRQRWWEPTVTMNLAGLLATFVACTVIAWLAIRNDWGRKSRY